MKKFFAPLAVLTAAMFAYAPIAIANAPYESTMLLIQKIFYFHVPSWMAMTAAIAVCGVASLLHLFTNRPGADRLAVSAAELAVLFGAMGLVTGPLWGRKAWGVWWQWDARLTMALLLELVFVSYLLVRAYGGPGSDKLAAAVGLFGMAVSPFVYVSVNIWRTVHPLNTVVPKLIGGSMPGAGLPFALSSVAFLSLFALLLTLRVNLASQQALVDELYLAEDDGPA
jgi:heme exporter protein C